MLGLCIVYTIPVQMNISIPRLLVKRNILRWGIIVISQKYAYKEEMLNFEHLFFAFISYSVMTKVIRKHSFD